MFKKNSLINFINKLKMQFKIKINKAFNKFVSKIFIIKNMQDNCKTNDFL